MELDPLDRVPGVRPEPRLGSLPGSRLASQLEASAGEQSLSFAHASINLKPSNEEPPR
jgi:hypothetical protein